MSDELPENHWKNFAMGFLEIGEHLQRLRTAIGRLHRSEGEGIAWLNLDTAKREARAIIKELDTLQYQSDAANPHRKVKS